MTIRLVCAAAAAVLAAIACEMGGAQAQGYPDKPIHIISGTQVGTSGDSPAACWRRRITAQTSGPAGGVFESRPGANGQIAANYLKATRRRQHPLYTASSTVVTGR